MKKKVLTVVLIVLCVLLGLVSWFVIRFNRMRQVMLAAPAADVDLSQLADGTYTGTSATLW